MKSRKLFILILLIVALISNTIVVYPKETDIQKGYVKVTTSLNVREKPSKSAKILKSLKPGDIVKITNTINDFYKISININGKKAIGFVSTEFVEIPKKNNKLISAAVITAKSSSDNRNYNMALAAKKLNGLLLKSGEEFNWYGKNGVGQANKANGFKQAPVIVNKKSVMGYGGGVCQVSTALYNCIYKLNIKPDELHHHSLKSSYVEAGMDATVSYPNKNFKFTNSKDYNLRFEVFTEKNRVIVLAYKK